MTPERALVDRVTRFLGELERTPLAEHIAAFAVEYAREQVRLREDYWTGQIQTFCDLANGSEAKLAAARQREEQAKGELMVCEMANQELRAENDRLTLAASESARTLQVEIERLKSELETHHGYYKCVAKIDVDAARVQDAKERDALQAQVTAAQAKIRDSERLADEVAVLVRRGILDARSPVGDALLDYRNPPSSPRADALLAAQSQVAALREALTKGRDLLIDASYLMQHFKETDAAYRVWRATGKEWLAALPQDGA